MGTDYTSSVEILCAICILVWAIFGFATLVNEHFESLTDYIIQILILRLSLIVPVYMFIFVLAFFFPYYWSAFEIALSVVEAYCIFCYFRALVLAAGGWEQTIKHLRVPHWNLFKLWQRSYPSSFLYFTEGTLIQLIILRPLLFILKFVADTKWERHELALGFQILSMIDLAVPMLFLLVFYHAMLDHIKYIAPTRKIAFIKGILLMLGVENTIISKINAGSSDHSHREKLRRLFALIVLGEILILSLLTPYIFGPIDEQPSGEVAKLVANTGSEPLLGETRKASDDELGYSSKYERSSPQSRCQLLVQVFLLHTWLFGES